MEASERKFRDIEVVAFGAETVNLLVTQRVIGNFTDRRKLLQRFMVTRNVSEGRSLAHASGYDIA